MAGNGLITIASAFPVKETIDRLVAHIAPLGLAVFARVDHATAAATVGMALRPTEVLIFGNPKGGTPLMQDRQTAGHRSAAEGARVGGRRGQGLADH